MPERVPTAVFISGGGSNLQAVIDACRAERLPVDLRLVVSNNAHAFGLERAKAAGISTAVMPFDRARETREDYARRLADAVEGAGARLVLLLGWMHVLAAPFLAREFAVLNLHPAFLPTDPRADEVTLPDGTVIAAFRGPHALRDALAARSPFVGASLIEITADVDRGPLLARRELAVRDGDDVEQTLARLRPIEQAVVREGVLRWLAQRTPA